MNPRLPVIAFKPRERHPVGLSVMDSLPESYGTPGPPVGIGHILLEPGGHSLLDSHEVKEIWLVASGDGRLIFEEAEERILRTGDIVMFESNARHRVFNLSDTAPLFLFSLWWR